jgi:hypothetical protein
MDHLLFLPPQKKEEREREGEERNRKDLNWNCF